MIKRCRRCNKPLIGEESIARGYGPLCWEKVKAGELHVKYRKQKSTVTDPVKASETRFKILDRILELKCPYDKCSCGTEFKHGTLKSYNHADGVPARGYKCPQWFYIHCDVCRHDTSLSKLNLKLDDLDQIILSSM